MGINLTLPETTEELTPVITVIGVGGAGCNAVNNMIDADLTGVEFLVANTDGQALLHSLAPRRIQLGKTATKGLGAGSKPEIGRIAAEESLDEVMLELEGSHMVFITAGMGGGTGTGAAPVIAQAARDRGILTVGVITKPFQFEGDRRMQQAEEGIKALQAHVDTLIVIPNQNLFRLANERTTFAEAFQMADAVLNQGVSGVTDLMLKPGLINLDFADIRSVMTEMGKAMMGTGEAAGDNRATEAAEAAINNPLLDDTSMRGARAILINITGGHDMGLFEVDEAANRIKQEIDPDALIIFGSAFDEKLEGTLRVSVVATGIDAAAKHDSLPFDSAIPAARMPSASPAAPQTQQPGQLDLAASSMAASLTMPSAIEEAAAEAEAEAEMHDDEPSERDDISEADHMSENFNEAPSSDDRANDAYEAQIDLDDVVAEAKAADKSPAERETVESGSEEIQSAASDETDTPSQGPILRIEDPSVATSQENIFIPDETVELDTDIALPEAAALAPAPKQASLITRLSGLWAPKADDMPAATKPDAAKERTASLMDLPKSNPATDIETSSSPNQASLNISPAGTSEADEAELEIPAFLRRQAN